MPNYPYHVEPYPDVSGPDVWPPKGVDKPKERSCASLSKSASEIEYQCNEGVEWLVKTVDAVVGSDEGKGRCRLTHTINVYRIAVGPCDHGTFYPVKPTGDERKAAFARFEELEAEIARAKKDAEQGHK